MRFSYNWLREFLPIDLAPDDLAKHLLLLGFEVTDTLTVGPGFQGVVVGKVMAVDKHPNADRLTVCRVTDGRDELSIVCGARNVTAGALVPVARIGAKLSGGREIERTTIRGVESQGMICSASELGLSAAENDGIMILPPQTTVGEDAAKLLGETDCAMEIEITPNRPDCLSHLGLARELSIHFMKDLQYSKPLPVLPVSSTSTRKVQVEAPNACRRYLGREFAGLRVGPSPGWVVKRLEAVGLRPINNLVDISNYVLFELGHPLHTFDSQKLQGAIRVRFADNGEKIRALDHQDYALAASDLVIADDSGPVAIAGVIGGEPTGVTEKTTSAFLESACFNPGVVRRTAKRLKIRTDSSHRFERGTDPESAALAAARASQLIVELCGKPSAGEWTDVYSEPSEPKSIEVSSAQINRILGTDHPNAKIEEILGKMAARVEKSEPGRISFTAPSDRLDLETIWDLAEEVGRHLGYDSIPAQAKSVPMEIAPADPSRERTAVLRRKLEARGFFEAYNYDFISKSQLAHCGLNPDKAAAELLNPLSEEWSFLRPTLLPGLLQNAVYNLSRGTQNLRLFEIGHVYTQAAYDVFESPCLAGVMVGDWPPKPHWREKQKPSGFYDAKGIVEDMIGRQSEIQWLPLGECQQKSTDTPLFHPKAAVSLSSSRGCFGIFGLLHPFLLKNWDIQCPVAAFTLDLSLLGALRQDSSARTPASAFPSSSRDISIVMDDSVSYEKVRDILMKLENLSHLDLIDVYLGKVIPAGKKSFTLRLTFTRNDRTLRDEEVEAAVAKALEALKRDCGAKLRT